jgi:hypothetical protein
VSTRDTDPPEWRFSWLREHVAAQIREHDAAELAKSPEQRAAEQERARANSDYIAGGMVAPGDCCPTCGGNGLEAL